MIAHCTMQTSTLWGAIRQPRILYPAIFVFLWQATPSAGTLRSASTVFVEQVLIVVTCGAYRSLFTGSLTSRVTLSLQCTDNS